MLEDQFEYTQFKFVQEVNNEDVVYVASQQSKPFCERIL